MNGYNFYRSDSSILIRCICDIFFILFQHSADPFPQVLYGRAGLLNGKLRDLFLKHWESICVGNLHAAEQRLQKAVIKIGEGIPGYAVGVLQRIQEHIRFRQKIPDFTGQQQVAPAFCGKVHIGSCGLRIRVLCKVKYIIFPGYIFIAASCSPFRVS